MYSTETLFKQGLTAMAHVRRVYQATEGLLCTSTLRFLIKGHAYLSIFLKSSIPRPGLGAC